MDSYNYIAFWKKKSHQIQIFQSSVNSFDHIWTFWMAIWARIERGTESTANFFDARFQLFALKEGHKSSFVNFIPLKENY